jgi:hypothetical protein
MASLRAIDKFYFYKICASAARDLAQKKIKTGIQKINFQKIKVGEHFFSRALAKF